MIVITGAAGFIGSCVVQYFNENGHHDLVLVDDFLTESKKPNWTNKIYSEIVERTHFFEWFKQHREAVSFVIHLGARTDTTELDHEIFKVLNVDYSVQMWVACAAFRIPLIYASSAATYGLGELGYEDRHDIVNDLQPLNPYGVSKNDFDKWALQQIGTPPFWAGLKFFNVYGPNEYHKGRMASVIFHTARQIKATGAMKLFKSHKAEYADGGQMRDFVYVKDVVSVIYFLYQQQQHSGIYNLGTGTARTFHDLASNTFRSLGLEPNISFVDTPVDIRDTYQYFTEANMQKLIDSGYNKPFYTLEEGIHDYVTTHLVEESIW
jgi:ADP-L-glycero-D-manno-heptose 6-epimerase